jgi:hypothetical protein
MVNEALLTVWYDGEPMISFDDQGKHHILPEGVRKARINGGLLDIGNGLMDRLVLLNEKVSCATVNPYRDALDSIPAIVKEIPPTERRGMNQKDVSAVVAAIVRLAARHVQ